MAPHIAPAPRPGDAAPLEEGPSTSGDILVVDDDPKNLLAIEVALGEVGARLIKAQSGEQALRLLLERDFALILLDVQMPNMDGFDAARIIRSRAKTRHVPIIFVTAFSHNDTDIKRGYALGAVDYLFKPIVPEILRAKVQVFIELRARTAEVTRQAQQLREMERTEAERRLLEERQRWEAHALRLQMEEQQRINVQLEEADRRKDEFIAVLAHELRNPLAPIVTSLELIRDRAQDPVINRAREIMERQTQHLVRLIDDLLDVARITQGKIELHVQTVDVAEAIDNALELSRPLLERKRHHVVVSRPAQSLHVQADAVRLCQIIGNLLSNAARYTDDEGRIELEWGGDDTRIWIRVQDNGRGLEAEQLDQVFEMFVQAQPGGPGLGLGLTLVRQLARMHGGEVVASSPGLGRGSEFVLSLPRGDTIPIRLTSEESVPGAVVSLRIALVEDQEDIREMVASLLEHWGHEVRQAESVQEGEALVCTWKPDVVLMDIGLPDGDGYILARRIRAAMGTETPRLVAVTGFGQEHDRQRAQAAGFDAHLTKPAQPEDLKRVLHGPSQA